MEKWIKDIYYYHATYNYKDLNNANTILEENSPGFYKIANWELYDRSKLVMSNKLTDQLTLQECINEMSKNGTVD